MTIRKVLFVDDEPNVLNAIRRSLRGDFDIQTAASGKEALQLLAEGQSFSVIVSDCRMPEMDGIEFLERARKVNPESVRVMLTGNADQETAVRAINRGDIFKFLNKPCDTETLKAVVTQAIGQYDLVTAEKELLEKTLKGSIKVLADLLGIVKPEAFGRTSGIRQKARALAKHVDGVKLWELDAAALLSQLGCINVEQRTLEKILAGKALTKSEGHEYVAHPLLGAELISRIPRLARVANIILYQNKNFDGSGFPLDDVKGDHIPVEARILRTALAFTELSAQDWSDAAIQEKLEASSGMFDPAVLAALAKTADYSKNAHVVRVLPSEITIGMVLQEDVKSDQGVMLICRGQEVTTAILKHLLRFEQAGALTKRLLVAVPEETRSRNVA
jgi:response regulator RpfG family c-di-GMP phosphodiesterase